MLLLLSGTDPLSIGVTTQTVEGNTPTTNYTVSMQRALAATVQRNTLAEPAAPTFHANWKDVSKIDAGVAAVSADAFSIISDTGRSFTYTLPMPVKPGDMMRDGKPLSDPQLQIGDHILYKHEKKTTATLEITSPKVLMLPDRFVPASLPPVSDQETANRIAKALVHAIVLCHKDEKPSAF